MAEASSDGCLLESESPTGPGAGEPAGRPDDELLRRYQRSRSPDDFAEISRRHWPMILRTSQRLVGNVHDAQDVAQSVFLALSQRPEAVRRSLAGYLHEAARAAASELSRSRRRRERREEEATRRGRTLGGGTPAEERVDLREELDAALDRLPDALKQAIILRYLEGHSQQEAARRAGCTPITMGWRSMKGLRQLRDILGRRGVRASSGVVFALLASEAQSSATAATATGVASTTAKAAATATARSLARQFALASPIRPVAAGLAVAVPLAVGAGLKLSSTSAPAPPPAAAPRPAPPSPPPAVAPTLGQFDRTLDVGRPAQAGSVQFADGRYTIRASGAHIYLEEDHFRYVCRPWDGDGEFIARVDVDPTQADVQVAAGIMVRERLEAASLHATLVVTRSESRATYRSPRTLPLSNVAIDDLPARGVQWVRVVRRGDRFTLSVRPDSATEWTLVRELKLAMARSLYVGLAVTSNDDSQVGTATIDRVSIRP